MANLKHVSPVVAPRPHNPYVGSSSLSTATNPLETQELGVLSEGVPAVVQPNPRRIPLSQGLFALVDSADYPELSKHKWFALKSGNSIYAGRGRPIQLMHRAILGTRAGFVTDHINGNGLDNRRCNLRFATYSQNFKNTAGRSSTGFKGVCYWPSKAAFQKYVAQISHGGRLRHIGLFDDPVTAAKAYDAAARKYHGEFAYLNFPNDGAAGQPLIKGLQ